MLFHFTEHCLTDEIFTTKLNEIYMQGKYHGTNNRMVSEHEKYLMSKARQQMLHLVMAQVDKDLLRKHLHKKCGKSSSVHRSVVRLY